MNPTPRGKDVLRIQKNLRLSTILVTHNVQEAVYMSDRVLVLGGTPAGIVHECCAEPENTSAHEVRTTPEFASCTRQILSALRASAGESPPSDPARSGIW